ncbi:hypothetical protein CYMTET_51493 [Cymbomonas tetramitiformis]|uniref:Methyltransferase type 11 domain-containing protein n=1 Tax=Cymbomonas tetramitiformis TaxID=36881 RepID=A0AAE0BM64_9CHLO|nr:hypothetical protein CYMTET_51493 [Cymbomonas tetramitiformis]
MKAQAHLYNTKYHEDRGLKCSGCKHVPLIKRFYPRTRKVLDAGAGQCKVIHKLQDAGLMAYGVELSTSSLTEYCEDLVESGKVKQGPLQAIPFQDDEFDLVFTSEVLEHVPEDDVDAAVAELVRVSKGHIFGTISLRRSKMDPEPPEQPRVHLTVRSRQWWDKAFAKYGCVPNQFVLRRAQRRMRRLTDNVRRGCVLKKPKGQECWKDGEIEPWYFAYICKGAYYNIPPTEQNFSDQVNEKSTFARKENSDYTHRSSLVSRGGRAGRIDQERPSVTPQAGWSVKGDYNGQNIYGEREDPPKVGGRDQYKKPCH